MTKEWPCNTLNTACIHMKLQDFLCFVCHGNPGQYVDLWMETFIDQLSFLIWLIDHVTEEMALCNQNNWLIIT